MRSAADFFAKLVRNCADVSSLCAGEPKCAEGFAILRETKIVNVNEPSFAFDFDSLASKFVKWHTGFFYG